MTWLLSIVSIPFPMDILASANDDVFPNSAVYVGTLLLATTARLNAYAIVYRTPALQAEDVNLRPGLISVGIGTASVAAAFAITLIALHFGLRPLFLLIAGIIGGQLVGRRFGARTSDLTDREDK